MKTKSSSCFVRYSYLRRGWFLLCPYSVGWTRCRNYKYCTPVCLPQLHAIVRKWCFHFFPGVANVWLKTTNFREKKWSFVGTLGMVIAFCVSTVVTTILVFSSILFVSPLRALRASWASVLCLRKPEHAEQSHAVQLWSSCEWTWLCSAHLLHDSYVGCEKWYVQWLKNSKEISIRADRLAPC